MRLGRGLKFWALQNSERVFVSDIILGMKKLVIWVVVLLVGAGGYFLWGRDMRMRGERETQIEDLGDKPTEDRVDFTANFEIYTNGTKRIFTQAMYHRRSPDVYIESSDPSLIYVKSPRVTWGDFFATLPMSVTSDCLVTGTGQRFCTNERQKLKFILNGVEQEVLDRAILEGDKLIIRYEDA